MSPRRDIQLAAALLSASIVASRLLGFVREAVLAALMGAGPETDAYLAAFVVPDLINHFLAGGALSTALLPIFAARLVGGRDREAWQLVGSVARLATGVLVVAVIAGMIWAEPILRLWYPGFDESQIALTAYLTRIILPGPLFFTLGAVLNATEQSRKRFLATALMPLVYNVCIIAGGFIGHSTVGIAGFSWGVLVGAALGPFLVPWIATRDVRDLSGRLPLSDPDIRRFFVNAAPILFSSSLIFFDEWLGRHFASDLEAGAITWLNNARRLMLVPAMLVGQAIGQAAFPFLARMRFESAPGEVADTLRGLLRGTAALSVVSALGLYAVADGAVRIVFERGAYTSDDAEITITLLAILAFAIPGWALYTVTLRTLHAAERMWTASMLGLATLVPSYFLYRALAHSDGVQGLALATPLAVSGATIVLLAAAQTAWKTSIWAATVRGLVEGGTAGALGLLGVYGARALVGTPSSLAGLARDGLAFSIPAILALVVLGGPAGAAVRRRLLRR